MSTTLNSMESAAAISRYGTPSSTSFSSRFTIGGVQITLLIGASSAWRNNCQVC